MKIWKVYDGINHWVIGNNAEEVVKIMKKNYIQWYGEDGVELEYLDPMEISQCDPKEEFTMHLDSNERTEIKLTIEQWQDLFINLVDEPKYWACSEW